MSKYCPLLNHNVPYLTCQECENKVCQTPSCSTCKHFLGYVDHELFDRKEKNVKCALFSYPFSERMIKINTCSYHNKDLEKELICYNCKYYLGGLDFGLACSMHYYRLPTPTSSPCEDFKRKGE